MMLFFALSVFTLGLVSAENNGVVTEMMPTYVNSTGTNATAHNTTAHNTTAHNTTTHPMPTHSETPESGAVSLPSALPATPIPKSFSPTARKRATTTRAKPIIDVVKPKTTTTAISGSRSKGVDVTGIIIICLVVMICMLIAGGCFFRHKRQRRFSMDLRTEGASVPLSVVVDHTEPDDGNVYNGMQTADNGQVDSKDSQKSEDNGVPKPKESGPTEDPKPKESGPTEDPKPKESGPTEDPKPKESGPTEDPKPKESGPTEDPKPKESGPTEDPQPKDSGVTEVPQPMAEQNEQAEQASLVEAGASAQPASPGPAEGRAPEGAAAATDEGVVSNQTPAESLKEPSEGTGSGAATEASATDALIEN